MIKKIISGGQTGADIGGLLFALETGIPCTANINKGFKPESRKVKIPKTCDVNIVSNETDKKGIKEKRRYNVDNSDFTIIFTNKAVAESKDSKASLSHAINEDKPYVVIQDSELPNHIVTKFRKNCVKKDCILNITGSKHIKEKEIVKIMKKITNKDIKWFECPICKSLLPSNPNMLVPEFKWTSKGRNEFRHHVGSRHPKYTASKKLRKLKRKYGDY